MATKIKRKKGVKKWSAKVTQTSDALDLKENVFKSDNPDLIAKSLKHSADESRRRKTTPFQSAMSMLNFYMNRAGRNLNKSQKAHLQKAKNKLRKLYGRPEQK